MKVVIDPSFVISYNTIMKVQNAGFFRPDHDPPCDSFCVVLIESSNF